MRALGLYLHIPFCKSKCLYCDFCSFPHPELALTEDYTDALCRELTEKSEFCRAYAVDSIYLGGGTPTLLPPRLTERILQTVFDRYHIAFDCEITAECNPATADKEKLRLMRNVGFNRLSMGVQSAQLKELKALGRLHDFADAEHTWEAAVAAGFANISADLMFGIPYQTRESFADTVEKLLALAPSHLSAYALTVEENTPFGRRGEENLHLPNEEAVRAMYLELVARLEAAGIHRYEISNFAKRGYESTHNLKYWNTEEYLGFGIAAHSDFGGERFANGTDIRRYLAGESIVQGREHPDRRERMNEYIMLRMRLALGISKTDFSARFGAVELQRLTEKLKPYLQGGFVKEDESGFAFGSEGMLVSNAILSELLDFS